MPRSRVGGAMATLVVVVVTVSLLDGGLAGAQNPPVNQPGVTPTEIRLGGVATVTGDPTGNTDGTAFDGTNAYFNYVNSTGGVCGRKLVLASKRDDMLANNRAQVQ